MSVEVDQNIFDDGTTPVNTIEESKKNRAKQKRQEKQEEEKRPSLLGSGKGKIVMSVVITDEAVKLKAKIAKVEKQIEATGKKSRETIAEKERTNLEYARQLGKILNEGKKKCKGVKGAFTQWRRDILGIKDDIGEIYQKIDNEWETLEQEKDRIYSIREAAKFIRAKTDTRTDEERQAEKNQRKLKKLKKQETVNIRNFIHNRDVKHCCIKTMVDRFNYENSKLIMDCEKVEPLSMSDVVGKGSEAA